MKITSKGLIHQTQANTISDFSSQKLIEIFQANQNATNTEKMRQGFAGWLDTKWEKKQNFIQQKQTDC